LEHQLQHVAEAHRLYDEPAAVTIVDHAPASPSRLTHLTVPRHPSTGIDDKHPVVVAAFRGAVKLGVEQDVIIMLFLV
jgi:hypothetical protein